jgi:hypothetical protein
MRFFLIVALSLITNWGTLYGESAIADLALQDGSRIRGRVMTTSASEVTVMTDFGVLRIELEKLTPETRQKLSAGDTPDPTALLQRIAELEAKVIKLQQENEQLRRTALNSTPSGYSPPTPASRFSGTPANDSASSTSRYSVSSTGKRHNSGCRYFGSGRSSGPNEGVPCKICGG